MVVVVNVGKDDFSEIIIRALIHSFIYKFVGVYYTLPPLIFFSIFSFTTTPLFFPRQIQLI